MAASDEWGVPHSMLGGRVSDDFAAGVARVVLLSSLMESKIHGLLSAVGSEPQDVWAGRSVEQLLAEVERLAGLGMPARTNADDDLLDALVTEVSLTRGVTRARNEVIHSVWPYPNMHGGLGWKLLPRKQRRRDWKWMGKVQTTDAALHALVEQLVARITNS